MSKLINHIKMNTIKEGYKTVSDEAFELFMDLCYTQLDATQVGLRKNKAN